MSMSTYLTQYSVFFFWHSGYSSMHPYAQRTVRAWYRRFSPSGWHIYVLNRQPNSLLNVANYLTLTDPIIFPAAFINGTLGGDHAPQHTSDLVRFPLLLKYGGVYADVGLMPIGDVNALWEATVGDPNSPYEVLSYNSGQGTEYSLMNYFLCSRAHNPFFQRCHDMLLALWASDGGRSSTEGMHASPLLAGIPMMGVQSNLTIKDENGVQTHGPAEVSKLLTDYIIQGQVITMVMSLVDAETGWNGPKYVSKHVYAPDYMEGSQLINELTAWDGPKAFKLMSLSLPLPGGVESDEQREAREIVEACLSRSFHFKLAHGLIVRVLGETLGSLWRTHEGSDVVDGTYAAWLRHGVCYWCPDAPLPESVKFEAIEPVKRGPLLREA